jgi:DNA-binding NarL/FixJ family response regulator
MNVLIADDSQEVRKLLRLLLEGDPAFEVQGEAENGLEALEKAVSLVPHLIIMDVSMPVMNGLDAAREINRAMPGVPIVLFTNFASVQKLQLLLSAGVAAVVDKADPGALLEVAHDVLRQNAA